MFLTRCWMSIAPGQPVVATKTQQAQPPKINEASGTYRAEVILLRMMGPHT